MSEIAELTAMQRALEQVENPAEAKALYDQLETLSQYAHRYGLDHDQQNEIAKTKLQTARKGGQLLSSLDARTSGRRRVLPDGMSWSMSSRWQTLAAIPDVEWPAALASVLKHQEELTLAAMLRIAKELDREDQRERNRDLVEQAPPLEYAGEQFATIVADPPWDHADQGDHDVLGRGRPTYAVMPIDELLELAVADRAAADAHLYLWVTNRALSNGFVLLEQWGFRYVTCITWVKPWYGMGNYFRGSTEHILFGVRGSLPLLRRDVGTHFTADRPSRRHSAKPDLFYDLVESCSPGPWLELFSRTPRPGWAAWGAEVPA